MGRFISTGTNSNGSGSANLPQLFSNVVAGEAVTQGTIAVVSADGFAYGAADPSLVVNATKPVFNPIASANGIMNLAPILPATQGLAASANANSGFGGSAFAGAFLSDGNFVVAWQRSSAPYTVQFAIFNPSGIQQGAIFDVATGIAGVSQFNVSVAAINGGGFVIAFARQDSPFMQYAVFGNSGNQIKALTTINDGVLSVGGYVRAAALSNGGFVIAYCANGVGTRFTIYDAIGNVTFVSGALCTSYFAVDVVAFSADQGGGFVIAYNNTQTGSHVAKYSNTGVTVMGETNVQGATNTYVAVCALTNGGFAVAVQNGAIMVSVFNATCNQVGATITTGETMPNVVSPRIVALSNGDCAVASIVSGGSSAFTVLAYVSATTGKLIKTISAATLPFTYNSNVSLSMRPNKYGGVSIYAGGGGITYNYLVAFDANLTMIGQLNNMLLSPFSSYAHYGSTPPLLMLSPAGNMAVLMVAPNGGNLTIGLLNTYQQRAIPVGVFAANANKGESVSIQYSGYVNLTVGFTQPYSVDARSFAGQCMNVVGNSATLYGVQNLSSNRRSIN